MACPKREKGVGSTWGERLFRSRGSVNSMQYCIVLVEMIAIMGYGIMGKKVASPAAERASQSQLLLVQWHHAQLAGFKVPFMAIGVGVRKTNWNLINCLQLNWSCKP